MGVNDVVAGLRVNRVRIYERVCMNIEYKRITCVGHYNYFSVVQLIYQQRSQKCTGIRVPLRVVRGVYVYVRIRL